MLLRDMWCRKAELAKLKPNVQSGLGRTTLRPVHVFLGHTVWLRVIIASCIVLPSPTIALPLTISFSARRVEIRSQHLVSEVVVATPCVPANGPRTVF